ncbi:hypothetical protein JTB14_013216 [Gonioctena quinquepunctata]|nr:hypothetical protein JTB14_013216 [Gonioctena quinquepunctata]
MQLVLCAIMANCGYVLGELTTNMIPEITIRPVNRIRAHALQVILRLIEELAESPSPSEDASFKVVQSADIPKYHICNSYIIVGDIKTSAGMSCPGDTCTFIVDEGLMGFGQNLLSPKTRKPEVAKFCSVVRKWK